jgi:hypothetical protein
MNSNDMNAQTVADAEVQLNQIFNFKFLLGLTIWNSILSRINLVNIALQGVDCTVEKASKHIDGLVAWITDFHDDGFSRCLKTAIAKAGTIGIGESSGFEYRITRGKTPSRYQDSTIKHSDNQNNIEKFKSEFFHATLEALHKEFKDRFEAIHQATSDFRFLWGKILESSTPDDFLKAVQDLRMKYPSDFDGPTFIKEINYLKSAVVPFLGKKILKKTTPMEILNILTANQLQQAFNNCHTALRIFLTLPVTVASNERSFSKLKIIKNYLRSSMGQNRLSDLAILSIEYSYTQAISFDSLIHDFAIAKCRRVAIE